MPVDYDRWYQNQINLGNLPDENGYYHYIPIENELIEKIDQQFASRYVFRTLKEKNYHE